MIGLPLSFHCEKLGISWVEKARELLKDSASPSPLTRRGKRQLSRFLRQLRKETPRPGRRRLTARRRFLPCTAASRPAMFSALQSPADSNTAAYSISGRWRFRYCRASRSVGASSLSGVCRRMVSPGIAELPAAEPELSSISRTSPTPLRTKSQVNKSSASLFFKGSENHCVLGKSSIRVPSFLVLTAALLYGPYLKRT